MVQPTKTSTSKEVLSERELASGMGMAIAEDDDSWFRKLIRKSPYKSFINDETFDDWLELVMGWSTTPKEAREQGEPTANDANA